jgi:DNA-binding NtrC family response regulator
MWRHGKLGILVVDDEKSVLATYALILQKQGYAVQTAISSVEAKDILDQHEFDLLLCDYSLEQEHTGFEVIDYARKKTPGVKAVLLTGYASKETADQAKDNDIQVLYKPIDIQEFFETIGTLLGKNYASNKESVARQEKGGVGKEHGKEGTKDTGKSGTGTGGRSRPVRRSQ